MNVESNLQKLGFSLPAIPKSLASYIPARRSGSLIFTSGQIPLRNGQLNHTGRVGRDISMDKAKEAVIICCLNALAAVSSVVSLDKITKIIKLSVFVNSGDEFTDQHILANSASDLLIELFGDTGKHSRSALGVSSLPMNSSVELELIVEVAGE